MDFWKWIIFLGSNVYQAFFKLFSSLNKHVRPFACTGPLVLVPLVLLLSQRKNCKRRLWHAVAALKIRGRRYKRSSRVLRAQAAGDYNLNGFNMIFRGPLLIGACLRYIAQRAYANRLGSISSLRLSYKSISHVFRFLVP